MKKHLAIFRIHDLPALLILSSLVLAARADDVPPAHHKADVKVWKANRASAKSAEDKGDLPEAEKNYKAALDEAENFDSKDSRLADSLRELGEVYYAEGNPTSAEPLLGRAVAILHGYPEPTAEIGVLWEYAMLARGLGHYDEAIKSYSRIQSIASQKFGRAHPLTVEASLYLAEAYFLKKDYADAEPLFKRCFELFRNPVTRVKAVQDNFGVGFRMWQVHRQPNYGYALEAANKLNTIYLKENRPNEAAAILKQTLEVVDENSSAANAGFVEVVYELCLSYIAEDNVDAAESIFGRLLNLADETKGNAKTVAFTAAMQMQSSITAALLKQGKTAEAQTLFVNLARSAEKDFGPESRECDTASANLAKFYIDQGDFEKAEPLYRQQYNHTVKFQPDGAALTPILQGQETIYFHLGRDGELDEVYKKQIVVFEKVFGQNSTGLVKPLTARAALLHKLNRDAEAAPLEARIAAIKTSPGK